MDVTFEWNERLHFIARCGVEVVEELESNGDIKLNSHDLYFRFQVIRNQLYVRIYNHEGDELKPEQLNVPAREFYNEQVNKYLYALSIA